VIATYCDNLEILNIQGSREAVTDRGFARYVQESRLKAKRTLRQLDVSRCMLTQVTLVHLQELTGNKRFFFLKNKSCKQKYNQDLFFISRIERLEVLYSNSG